MKYEIITDKEDMLVLIVNSRIIAVSQDMTKIIEIMQENYTNHRNNKKISYESALIYPELDAYEDKPAKIDTSKIKVVEAGSLGKLLGLDDPGYKLFSL